MPKKIDPVVKERAVRLVLEHRAEYPSMGKALAAVARQEGVGVESLRRWVIQAEGSAARLGDSLTCPIIWVPVTVANWQR